MSKTVRMATRGSGLALAQARWVAGRLQELYPDREFAIHVFKTLGDSTQRAGTPLAEVGGKGLFTKELEEALLDGRADLAVHSLKDLPTDLPPGLTLGAVPVREEPRDAAVTAGGQTLAALPAGSRVGTSSLRRMAQLRHWRPDLEYVPVRGNVETRLAKLDAGQYDALIMAAAGLRRLDLAGRIAHLLEPEVCLPAAGQGALGIEIRAGDAAIAALVGALHDPETAATVLAERAFLGRVTDAAAPDTDTASTVMGTTSTVMGTASTATGTAGAAPPLGGSCQVPIGAYARLLDGGQVQLKGLVALPDGSALVAWEGEAPVRQAQALGLAVAEAVLQRGGRELLAQVHLGGG